MTSMLKSLKNVFAAKDQVKTVKESDSSSDLTNTIEKPSYSYQIEKINNNEIPSNIFPLNEKPIDLEYFNSAEEVIENILTFLLSTSENNAKELIALQGINSTWLKITENDKFWKPSVTFFQLGYPEVEVDTKLPGKDQYYAIRNSFFF
jgi:ribosomal protein S8